MQQPKVSIISVNYNQAEVTCEMLESLRGITWPNVEIMVVDNASPSDCSSIKQRYPEIIYIESKVNLGFAGGNNLAIKECTGDYILLLNNDTIVNPSFIEPMIETFQQNKHIGIVSPKIIFYYSEGIIQYAGTKEINPMTCRGETIGYMQKDDAQFKHVSQTNLCHGACMMLSREVIDRVGLLDENYFMYYEEYDYCERVKHAGYQIYYDGRSHILHKQSISVGKNSPLKSYYMTRNRIYFSRKNFTGLNRMIAIAYNYAIAIPKNTLLELMRGRWQNSLSILKGGIWNISHKVQPG